MPYLNYDEYIKSGGSLLKPDFERIEFKIAKRLDGLTHSRIKKMSAVPEAVKRCMVELVKLESTAGIEAQLVNPTVTSFSADGYSETYGKALGADDVSRHTGRIVREYLIDEVDDYGIPLLYRGV